MCLQSFIGLGLSIGKATEKGHDDYGTAWGVAGESSPAEATWGLLRMQTPTSYHDAHCPNGGPVMFFAHHEALQNNGAQQGEAPEGYEHWDVQAGGACSQQKA